MPHTCHALGCIAVIPPSLFMCRRHWYRVPRALRMAIWQAYRPGQEVSKDPSEAYIHAAKAAIAAVAQQED